MESITEKRCRLCQVELTQENWSPSRRRKSDYSCKSCHSSITGKWRSANLAKANESVRNWKLKHKDRVVEMGKKCLKKLREEVLAAYGHKCDCCGENRSEFLAVDHVNGGGNEHRRQIGTGGGKLWRVVRKEGFPDKYRILCHNCNMSLGFYGYCPHVQKAESAIQ